MKRSVIISFLVLVFAAAPVHGFKQNFTKEEKLVALNTGALLAITAWGVALWDYGENHPSMKKEGWFQEDTDKGGADKLGHFYSNYVISHGFSSLYESWGYEHDKAALYGALSSFGLIGFMEIADSISEFGFSPEDFAMNFLGSCAGYFLSMHPDIARKIDFRVEYIPTFQDPDIVTDYEKMRFFVALKLDGFDAVTNKYLKYLELHLGDYVNGYEESGDERSRNIYAGVGINISKIFNGLSYKRTSKFFNYYQLPCTYIKFNKDLDE
ncbi:MAG: DUF2279 domain-containing protein [Thermodesulfobacteriota bacterium]|nr:DUF2279 domain-containing protein [Thermodesulfobacteriota bacterium]